MDVYAIVKDGEVINTVLVDGEVPTFLYEQGELVLDQNKVASIGMLWDGSAFINPPTK